MRNLVESDDGFVRSVFPIIQSLIRLLQHGSPVAWVAVMIFAPAFSKEPQAQNQAHFAQVEHRMNQDHPPTYDIVVDTTTLRAPAELVPSTVRASPAPRQLPNFSFCLFWPDRRIITCKGSEQADRFDIVINAIAWPTDEGRTFTAEEVLRNLMDAYGELVRSPMEQWHLQRIKIRQNDLIEYFLGRNSFGIEVLYECDTQPNSLGRQMCRTANRKYVHDKLGISLFYYFSSKLLPNWYEIDRALWQTVDGWKAAAGR